MLSVEDWAEIRRLHRAEGMPIKVIARVMGCSRNTVRAALAADGPPRYRAGAGGVGGGRGRAADPGVVGGVPDDAGDGDRRADRLDAWDDGVQGAGRGSCGRCICRRTRRRGPAMSRARSPSAISGSPTSRCRSGSGRPARATQLPVLTMVTGYSRWLSRGADPVPGGGGPVRRLVALLPRLGGGAAGAGVGRGRRGRPVAPRADGADRGGAGVPRHPRRRGSFICNPADPEAKGLVERAQRLPGDARSCPAARSPARPTSTPSWPAWLALVEHPPAAGAGLRADRADRRGPGGDAAAAAGARR